MSPRTGRPTTDPKENQYRIRLSDSDKEKLDYCHEHTGLPKSEIIRQGIDMVYKELTKANEKD